MSAQKAKASAPKAKSSKSKAKPKTTKADMDKATKQVDPADTPTPADTTDAPVDLHEVEAAAAAQDTRPTEPSMGKRFLKGTLYALALPIALVIGWSIWATNSPSNLYPSPQRIFAAFIDTWVGPAFLTDVLPSLGRLGIGLLGSIALGIAAGTLIGTVRWMRELTEPLLEFFRAIPPPAMIPIIVLFMGPTDSMKIVVIILGAVWPVLLNTIDGVRATDSVMKDTAKSFQLTRGERFRFLILPAAMPRIMTGVRQSMSIALILMVISEISYASTGLGAQVRRFESGYLMAEMWSLIVLLGLTGILLAFIFGFVERRMLRWYHGIKEVENA